MVALWVSMESSELKLVGTGGRVCTDMTVKVTYKCQKKV